MLNTLFLAWLDAPYQSTDMLFGVPIFWWSRIAKIIQFISGLIIVVDIVGAEKVKNFGTKLRNSISIKSIKSTMVKAFKLSVNQYSNLFKIGKPTVVKDKIGKNILFAQLIWVNVLGIGIPAMCYLLFKEGYLMNLTQTEKILLLLFSFILLLLHGVLFTLLQIIINITIALFDIVFIEPIALFVQLYGVEARAKKVSLFLFLVGFSIDILTS